MRVPDGVSVQRLRVGPHVVRLRLLSRIAAAVARESIFFGDIAEIRYFKVETKLTFAID